MKLEALIKLDSENLLTLEANLEQGPESTESKIGRVIWQPSQISGKLKNMFPVNIMFYDEFLKIYREIENKVMNERNIGDVYESKF